MDKKVDKIDYVEAHKVVLEAIAKRIKKRLENNTLTLGDSYIASLLFCNRKREGG